MKRKTVGLLRAAVMVSLSIVLSSSIRAETRTSGCTGGIPDVGYGDGSSGSHTIPPGTTFVLPTHTNYTDFTVSSGATLDIHGNVLRVCGTLTNNGTIKDTYSGGSGGTGGDPGRGGDPNGDGVCRFLVCPRAGLAGAHGLSLSPRLRLLAGAAAGGQPPDHA